jgi:hypothetical protein
MLRPPIPEDESKELAAVLLDGVVIVTPFGPVYVVVGAITRPAMVVQEFSKEFMSFVMADPVVVDKPLPEDCPATGH